MSTFCKRQYELVFLQVFHSLRCNSNFKLTKILNVFVVVVVYDIGRNNIKYLLLFVHAMYSIHYKPPKIRYNVSRKIPNYGRVIS